MTNDKTIIRKKESNESTKLSKKIRNLREMYHSIKIKKYDAFFGKDNYILSNNRFRLIKRVISDDEIIITTNNISYWKNKDQFVMWIHNNKIIYLRASQISPVYNYEALGGTYIVRLNRKYFKEYSCFTNEALMFYKEESFDDLKLVAKEQEEHSLWFKPSCDDFGDVSFL